MLPADSTGEQGEEAELRDRLISFFEQVDRYREQASFLSVHELLWRILMESGYLIQVPGTAGRNTAAGQCGDAAGKGPGL